MSLYTESFEVDGQTWHVGRRVLWKTAMNGDMPGVVVGPGRAAGDVVVRLDQTSVAVQVQSRLLEPLPIPEGDPA